MALNDTTDRPISVKNGRYETAGQIEMRNYLLMILRLHREGSDVIWRLSEAVERGERQLSYKK